MKALSGWLLAGAVVLGVGVLVAGAPAAGAKRYCAVCDGPIEGLAAQRRIGGHRVLVHVQCAAKFDRDPDRFASRALPQGALFQEQVRPQPPVGRGWLFLALYVLFGLCFGAACAYLAIDRGRPAKAWFALGFLFSLVALIVLLTRPRPPAGPTAPGLAKVPTTREPVPCPGCGASNHPASERCTGCGRPLDPRAPSEVSAALSGS